MLTKEPEREETVDTQKVPGRVHLSPSTASQQPDAVEEVQTGGDEKHDHTGCVSGSPYYLMVGVKNGEDEDGERDCGDNTEREVFERDKASNGGIDELTALAFMRCSLTDASLSDHEFKLIC